jgi:beta-glucosidase
MIVSLLVRLKGLFSCGVAYLCGTLAGETVRGMQEAGVIAATKHYIANEQETNRNPFGDVEAVSANIDDKTLHELYLWPFANVVHAGSGSIMCSYNRVNNSYSCQNSKLLNGILKTELGFEGFVVSDWGAQRQYFDPRRSTQLTHSRHRIIFSSSRPGCRDAEL